MVEKRQINVDGAQLSVLEFRSSGRISLINPETLMVVVLSPTATLAWGAILVGSHSRDDSHLLKALCKRRVLTDWESSNETDAKTVEKRKPTIASSVAKKGRLWRLSPARQHGLAFTGIECERIYAHRTREYIRALKVGKRTGNHLVRGGRLSDISHITWPTEAKDCDARHQSIPSCGIDDSTKVRFMLRLLCGPMNCLQESVAVATALRSLGHDATVFIGHEKTNLGAATPLHAWAQLDGFPVNEGADFSSLYSEVATIVPIQSVVG